MISRTSLAPALLALVLGAAAGQAQPGSEDPAGPAPPDAGTGESSAGTEGGNTGSGNSPFDYRASEEISEDLPVSFPVDI
jgi:hypothetical protein